MMWKHDVKFLVVLIMTTVLFLLPDVSSVEGFKGDAIRLFRSHNYFLHDISDITTLRGGAAAAAALNPFPSGYHPMGYGLTDLGKQFLDFDGSLDSDIGRFLASLKSGKRKSQSVLKEQWLEVVRVSKQGQSMRVYRQLDDLIAFCLKAGFID